MNRTACQIVVATHKAYWMPSDGIYLPVQVGAAGKESLGYVRDDTGDSISTRNESWCELTGLYWAWKNVACDVLGIVHYRRHFKGSTEGVLSGEECARLLAAADVILPCQRNYFIETTYQQYAHAHHAADLDLTREILLERCPDCVPYWDRTMASTKGHRFNMFIMPHALADAYCTWLFGILFELERRLDLSSYSDYNRRVFGFIGERLLDPWVAWQGLRVAEVPVRHLESQHWPTKIIGFLRRKFGWGGRI